MEKCAVIDIGSNTIRMCAYQYEGINIKELFSKKVTAGLASYVKKGALTAEGTNTACEALLSFKELLFNLGIENCCAFATASLRNISNTDEVLSVIEERTGIRPALISGRDEGLLSLRGAAESVNITDGLLADLGGGSTELVPFKNRKACSLYSIKAGSLTLYRKFVDGFLPDKKECRNISEYYEGLLSEEGVTLSPCETICGVGGSFRAIAKLTDHIYKKPTGTCHFTRQELEELYKILKAADKNARDLLLQITPDRLHTVVPAIAAVRVIMEKACCREVKVSRTGVREGYMFSRVLGL